jgi:hypothetical protein
MASISSAVAAKVASVMPTKVGIHVFVASATESRGWRAFARHDGGRE